LAAIPIIFFLFPGMYWVIKIHRILMAMAEAPRLSARVIILDCSREDIGIMTGIEMMTGIVIVRGIGSSHWSMSRWSAGSEQLAVGNRKV
jgi:hypothetical protein